MKRMALMSSSFVSFLSFAIPEKGVPNSGMLILLLSCLITFYVIFYIVKAYTFYFSLGYGQAMMPPSMTLTFFQPLPSRASAAS